MRFYSAGNYYLSSIQQGIQAFHCLGDMISKYPYIPCGLTTQAIARETLHDWMQNHKTLICVNGGNNQALNEFYALLTRADAGSYPVAKFHEDEISIGGMLTCVGIVLPAKIYEAVPIDEVAGELIYDGLTPWEIEVLQKIKRMPLAR